MYVFNKILILLLCITAAACQSDPPVSRALPDWVNNPQDGAVGSAVTHIKGRYAQEELALARARERLAARYGVEVSSVQTITEKVANERAYVTSSKQIEQAVARREVKAQLRELYYDAARDVVWVWVYPVE